jgi:hypothetical protein
MSSYYQLAHIDGWQCYANPNARSVNHFYINDRPLCGVRYESGARAYVPPVKYCELCDEQVQRIVDLNMRFGHDRMKEREAHAR